MAQSIARLLHPYYDTPVGSLIQYETHLMKLRNLVVEQRKYMISEATKENELSDWSKRVMKQGAWDPVTDPWPLDGASALPMPVQIAQKESLIPFFEHLACNGTEMKFSTACAAADANEIEEPYYNVKCLEFDRGVLYSDRRLDLCKMVVGPKYIANLMESLKTNKFVEHFLLGNNIIGPGGARCISNFLKEVPDRISTWYLAGNCIDSISFGLLVDQWVRSPVVTNIWLKRNPLMPESADDVFRLITQTPNLRTLDLDQTQLGDAGIATLFEKVANYTSNTPKDPLPLRHIYLNAVGIGIKGAKSIAKWLASDDCQLDAIYAGNNPLGNDGVIALAKGLKKNKSLTRMTLTSVGMSDDGVIALCAALSKHPSIKTLDFGQNFATPDLGSRYNWITDRSMDAIHNFCKMPSNLAYLNLGHCALTHVGINHILEVVKGNTTFEYFFAKTIYPQERTAAAVAAGKAHARLKKQAQENLETNVARIYGVSYGEFLADHKRWLVNDMTDVRKIDSVYRNRDAGMARRGLKRLDKWWGEGDETLQMALKHYHETVSEEVD
ncbi:RNI-like protein [Karstenula rhodostoma CBS 690.94]|uniref:RNI-like protein n=1 Tax=Karstenula rhodostoma CBS 690.94 TaxID=1392251 RepID=A0A9P4UJF2_9PLEO|nr:RNI-like protein [Karstenula rhodostoma CBS 690.94]